MWITRLVLYKKYFEQYGQGFRDLLDLICLIVGMSDSAAVEDTGTTSGFGVAAEGPGVWATADG